ncbi:MAG TPA: peptidylprolyl isomerase [Beijerinckiaceae bacterium]|nr:peptidylprolyl isomerase [Beijerinckiaceae bacterium]
MSPLLKYPLAAFILTFGATVALAQGAKPPASIDGVPITEQDLKLAQDDIGGSMQGMNDDQKKRYLVDYMLDLKLLARAAEKEKLAETPDFARKLAYLRDRALMEELMAREGASATSDDKLKKFYEEAVKGLPPEEEAKARHILVPTEDEARKVADRLKAGEDFGKVSTEVSKDPGSAKEGGDLGWFTKDRMVKEFADAAFALKAGETSAPVKSQFGWHVIRLDEKRIRPVPPLSEVKEELSRYLAQKAQQDMILKLRATARIERADPVKSDADKAAPAEPKKP